MIGLYRFYYDTAFNCMVYVSLFIMLTILSIGAYQIFTCTYLLYFKSKKELDYNRFADPHILGASRLVHSDLRIYQISFFLLDVNLLIYLYLLLTHVTMIRCMTHFSAQDWFSTPYFK